MGLGQSFAVIAWSLLIGGGVSAQEPIQLFAAGSLKAALGEVVENYQSGYEAPIVATFGPSGLLRQSIEAGETPEIFASANMKHPMTLEAAGYGGPVVLFARNQLCGLAKAGLAVTEAGMLDVLLDPSVRVGTSTPKADPSGDYAFDLFAKADGLREGAREVLEAKALQLTGGPDSETPPEGRNAYGWVVESDQADIFLTYCTNAVLAKQEVSDLEVVPMPPDLRVGADYGLIVLDSDNPDAWQLAMYILSPKAQAILARYGFDAVAMPKERSP